MGSVWAAHHELIGRDIAIKMTGDRLAKRPEIRERFLNEARAVGKLRHPNVIDVLDVGQLEDGRLYIVFELLDGHTLADHLEKNGRLAAGDAAMIVIEMCRGLEAAHNAGIVHRDLKPANIFLHTGPMGGVVLKLLDFGISKTTDDEGVSLSMTQTGMVMGTPQYMSVEQAQGRDDIDLRIDIWGAGVILYELVTGRLPFEASNYNAMLDKIMHEEPTSGEKFGVSVFPALSDVIQKCLKKQRSQRYQSAKELREALELVLPYLPVGSSGFSLERSSGLVAVPGGLREKKTPPGQTAQQQMPTIEGPRGETEELTVRPDTEPPPSSAAGVWRDDTNVLRGKAGLAAVVFGVAALVAVSLFVFRTPRGSSVALPSSTVPVSPGTSVASVEVARPEAPVAPAPSAAAPTTTVAPVGRDPLLLPSAPPARSSAGRGARKAPPVRPGPDPAKKPVTKVDNAGF